MKRQKIGTFNNLKNGDLIISPIDNEVTQYYIDKDGIKYLSSKNSLFGIFQFDAEDFYFYNGERSVFYNDAVLQLDYQKQVLPEFIIFTFVRIL